MPLTFLFPRVERLTSDGRFERLNAGGAIGRLRPPVVLLARNLCTFSFMDGGHLSRRHQEQAAKVHAQAASPYIVGGTAKTRTSSGYGIWWWDLEHVMPMLGNRSSAGPVRLRPETLAQPAGNGWRIVALGDGYEAQFWQAGALRASSWRRDRFDTTSWSAFTRLLRTDGSAPETPPSAITLPLAFDSEALSITSVQISRNQAIALGAGTLATTLATIVMFWIGQALTLRNEADLLTQQAAIINENTARTTKFQVLESDRRRLLTYRQIEQRTNPVAAAGAAIGILALYDLTPTAVNVTNDELTVTLAYSAIARSSDLVTEFEGSGYFFDVRPRTEATNGTLVMEMKVRAAAPPLSAVE